MSISILSSTKNLSRDEWLQIRKQGIGGSDVSAIFGVNPYKSAMELYADKLGLVPEAKKTWFMERGNALEEPLARWYSDQTGVKVQRRNKLFQHPQYPWMLANIDRWIVGTRKGLECKTGSPFSQKWQDGDAPAEYVIQCQHYMAVLDAEEWDLVYVLDGHQPKYLTIKRDEEAIKTIIERTHDFWFNHVVAGIPPECDSSESCKKALSHLYSSPVPTSSIHLESDALIWAQEYKQAAAEIKAAEERKELASNTIRSMLGDNEIGLVDGQVIATWKQGKKARTLRVVGGADSE